MCKAGPSTETEKGSHSSRIKNADPLRADALLRSDTYPVLILAHENTKQNVLFFVRSSTKENVILVRCLIHSDRDSVTEA